MKIFSFSGALVVITVVMTIQENSWIILWMLMEINMVGMTMQLTNEIKKESIILFIIFQSLPAICMLTYLSLSSVATKSLMSPQMSLVILASMMCKIGMFPLNNWILKLSNSISWFNNLVLMTWQKLIPLMLMMKISWSFWMVMMAVTPMTLMAMNLLNVMSMKCFLMSSSLVHMGWMVMGMQSLYWMAPSYMIMYSLILFMVIKKMKKKSKKTMNDQMDKPINSTKLSMLSLAGIPPMMGFLAKTMVLMAMMWSMESKKMAMAMLMVATISFYAYMQTIYKSMMMMSNSQKVKKEYSENEGKKTILLNTSTALVVMYA